MVDNCNRNVEDWSLLPHDATFVRQQVPTLRRTELSQFLGFVQLKLDSSTLLRGLKILRYESVIILKKCFLLSQQCRVQLGCFIYIVHQIMMTVCDDILLNKPCKPIGVAIHYNSLSQSTDKEPKSYRGKDTFPFSGENTRSLWQMDNRGTGFIAVLWLCPFSYSFSSVLLSSCIITVIIFIGHRQGLEQ